MDINFSQTAEASAAAQKQRIREAARGMEAVLLRQMIAAMEKAQLEEGFFGSGTGSKVHAATFQSFLSELLAEDEPLGLAEQLSEELTEQMNQNKLESKALDAPNSFDFFRWEAQDIPTTADESDG